MKFNDSLKHVKVGERVGRLQRTDMFFACFCGTITGWRLDLDDCPPAVICSDECLDIFDGVTEKTSQGPASSPG